MAAKKRATKQPATRKPVLLRDKTDLAWKNFTLFLLLFLVSFVLYNVSSSVLYRNFFGILSVVLGFLAFAILIAFIVLVILKNGRK